MSESFGRIVAIVMGVLIMFYLPLLVIGLKADNTTQAQIDNAVVEFVDNARATGRISPEAYEHLCAKIDMVQPFCEIEITHSGQFSILNEIGETEISYYDTAKLDILDYMYPPTGENRYYEMKNGDFLNVTVYNTKATLGTKIYRFIMPMYAPNETVIYTTYSGYVGNYAE